MEKGRIFPTWEQIEAFRNPLTGGEQAIIKFLDTYLPPVWEIYVQPFLNGSRPDVVILNPQIGMMVFEVKDWQPEYYHYEVELAYDKKRNRKESVRKYFVANSRGTWPIPSPVGQVERYRNSLIELYIPEIGEAVDSNSKNLSAFKIVLYFHNMTTQQAKQLVPVSAARCIVFGNDELEKSSLSEIVPDVNRKTSLSMKQGWADKIRFWLMPPFHSIEQGMKLELTGEQKRHVEPSPGRHQRLRGVAGSGKSLVLAQRAANLASQGKKVLIVTFNITLWHYVKDFVSRARVNFGWEQIEFTHFHGFCRDFLYENDVSWPAHGDEEANEDLFNETVPRMVMETVQAGKNKKGRKYDAILIDEGQDFQRSWYDALCEFLTDNDEVLLVVDKRQNVYQRDLSWIDSMQGTKFRGRWRELKESYRLPQPILEQANRFAQMFLGGVGIEPTPNVYQLGLFDPHLVWRDVNSFDQAKERILKAIKWLTEKRRIHPQDIVVLIPTHSEGWELINLLEQHKFKVNHVFEDEIKRHHHKKSFWMGDSRLKACTIHSFKGWELRNVIILTPSDEHQIEAQRLDYLLYTAITRARENLIVFNRHAKYKGYGAGWPQSWQ